MSLTTAPQLTPSLCLGNPDVTLRMLAKAVDRSTVATALFRLADLGPVYLNGRARQLLDPGATLDWSSGRPKLAELIGPTSIDLFQSQIRSHLNVLGRWHGECELVDSQGNNIHTVATFSRLDAPPDPSYVCLQALAPSDLLAPADRSLITDQTCFTPSSTTCPTASISRTNPRASSGSAGPWPGISAARARRTWSGAPILIFSHPTTPPPPSRMSRP